MATNGYPQKQGNTRFYHLAHTVKQGLAFFRRFLPHRFFGRRRAASLGRARPADRQACHAGAHARPPGRFRNRCDGTRNTKSETASNGASSNIPNTRVRGAIQDVAQPVARQRVVLGRIAGAGSRCRATRFPSCCRCPRKRLPIPSAPIRAIRAICGYEPSGPHPPIAAAPAARSRDGVLRRVPPPKSFGTRLVLAWLSIPLEKVA